MSDDETSKQSDTIVTNTKGAASETTTSSGVDSPAVEDNPLTREEELDLLRAVSMGTGRGFTQAEAEKVWQWAIDTRNQMCFLELTLKGYLKISFREDGELLFDAVEPEKILKSIEGNK